jgi:hypothetical protein
MRIFLACTGSRSPFARPSAPIILVLPHLAEAGRAEARLREVRLDGTMRHLPELLDEFEIRGLLPPLAERAKAG